MKREQRKKKVGTISAIISDYYDEEGKMSEGERKKEGKLASMKVGIQGKGSKEFESGK